MSIYPYPYPNTTGNSTYFTIDLSNGAFVCDGVFTVCYEDLILNNNTFKDVISVDTRASDNSAFIQVTKIYFSKEYGIAGYVLNNGAVFSRKL